MSLPRVEESVTRGVGRNSTKEIVRLDVDVSRTRTNDRLTLV